MLNQTLLSGAHTALRNLASPVQVRDALWRCVEKAIEHASAEQHWHGHPIWVTLTSKSTQGQCASLLSTDFSSPSLPSIWKNALREVITESRTLDLQGLDIGRFCETAFTRHVEAVALEASKPNSKLTNAVVVSALQALLANPNSPSKIRTGEPVNNLHMFPAPATIFTRPEVEKVQTILRTHSVAHLSGGPGSGKSSVARLIAEKARRENPELSIWWMDGTSHEALEASCAELCTELRVTPGDDILGQTKALLADGREWVIVIDNLTSISDLDAVIPSGAPQPNVIVTTLSPLGSSAERRVPFNKAGRTLMHQIASAELGEDIFHARGDALMEECDGNPLVLATVCRYLTATGATDDDIHELLSTSPDRVLDETLGGYYPTSFAKVVQRSLLRIKGTIGTKILAALALSGGRLRRSDLGTIVQPDSRTDLLDGLRSIRTLGLIEESNLAISCHTQLAGVLSKSIDERLLFHLAERTYSVIESEALLANGHTALEYAIIADNIRSNLMEPTNCEFGARLVLAGRLCMFGNGRTADEQLVRALEALPDERHPRDIAVLLTTQAGVLLHRGSVHEAEKLARTALEHVESSAPNMDSEEAASFIVQADLCISQCRVYLRDWQEAARFAERATIASGDDPELRAFELKTRIPLLDSNSRLSAYREIAETSRLSAGTRAEAFALASQTAINLEQPELAASLARRALELDAVGLGTDSQFYARDLNDLGNALLELQEYDEAERSLRESISIYERELSENGFAVLPRMHLARLLTDKQRQNAGPPGPLQCDAALEVLRPALRAQLAINPLAIEMSSLLVAQANATASNSEAIELLGRAVDIDRELYGNAHPEVCIDVVQRANRLLAIEDTASALEGLRSVVQHVSSWDSERPTLAANALSLFLLALAKHGPTIFGTVEGASVCRTLEGLLPKLSKDSWQFQQAVRALSDWGVQDHE